MILKKRPVIHFILTWLLSTLVCYFALGFFQNFYQSHWALLTIATLLNTVLTLVFEIVLERITESLKTSPKEKIVASGVLILSLLLIVQTIRILAQYPSLFSFNFILPATSLIPGFLGITILSQIWTAFIIQKLDMQNWQTSPFILQIKRNLPGLLLASAISVSTYLMATILVSANLSLTDNYFDADSPLWLNFMTANADQILSLRAVHPLALLILRPPVWLLSLLLNGNKFHAALLLNSSMGGVCAYLIWSFFKKRTGNTAYALLIATLLGFSTAHLFLSVFLESYIFSAVALIACIVLLEPKNNKFPHLVVAGLATFGITISNFTQTCIAFFLVRRDIKTTFKYVMIVLALAITLAFVQHTIYPTSNPFYIPSNLTKESAFRFNIFEATPKILASRTNIMFRNITILSIVAPRPLIFLEEIGCSYPCFNTIRFFRGTYQYASYIGFGSLLARAWFLGLLTAFLLFVRQLYKSFKLASLQFALLLSILFNFILHMNYGDDPLLYSPDWTYALVFFFGISFETVADKKWFQSILLLFVTALLFNNLELFRKIFETILPFAS